MTHEENPSLGRILAYSLPAAPLVFMTFLVNLYRSKLTTDVLLIAPALFAVAFAGARVWDALSILLQLRLGPEEHRCIRGEIDARYRTLLCG